MELETKYIQLERLHELGFRRMSEFGDGFIYSRNDERLLVYEFNKVGLIIHRYNVISLLKQRISLLNKREQRT